MRSLICGAALPLLLAAGAPALACPLGTQASREPLVLAQNAAPADGTKALDSTAFPKSPNGSPATADKGAPVVTDKAACSGSGATATCPGSPAPSKAADTSDTKIATPTTVGTPAKP